MLKFLFSDMILIMKKEDIIKKLNEIIPIIKDKYHIKSIGVFGSYIRGEAREDSDLDILVEFCEPIGFFDFIRLENFLSKLFGKKVDLISKKALKQVIKNDILKEVIYV